MARVPAIEQNNPVKGIFEENFRGLVLLEVVPGTFVKKPEKV